MQVIPCKISLWFQISRISIKESKNWISGELETVKNSIATLDTGLKGLTSLQMQTKAKTKTGNSSDSSTNTKAMTTQTQHESSPPPKGRHTRYSWCGFHRT